MLAGAAMLLGACSVQSLAPKIDRLTQLTIPQPIRVPAGYEAVVDAQGRGNLVYECQAVKRSPYQYDWLLQSQALTLQDSRGQTITYYPGVRSRWIHSDGSAVSAREYVEVDAGAGKLPLMRASAEMSTGPGALDNVSYIQNLRTVGGVVTEKPCAGSSLGMRVSVPYESDFVFWRRVSG